MRNQSHCVIKSIVSGIIGEERSALLFKVLEVPTHMLKQVDGPASRAVVSQALNIILFEDLLNRVPIAKTYADDCAAQGRRIRQDHGAVRTVSLNGMGSLPSGEGAITRILEPLGYRFNEVYPLDSIRMVGRSYLQADYPDLIPQFFISELYPERFTRDFQIAVARVTAASVDPISTRAQVLLSTISEDRSLPTDLAVELLPQLVKCFDRQHPIPSLDDYEAILTESAEMAWISTEGNAFNHATDRVPDIDAVSAEQKALGRPIKDAVETSASGRVKQTAFHAAKVKRPFVTSPTSMVEREVPGSFYEFITRMPINREGILDLGFDRSNAQAIFKMTSNAPVT